MQSRLKHYHSPATCLYFCGAAYYNHIKPVEQNVQNVLTHIQRMEVAGDDNWLRSTHIFYWLGDGILQLAGCDEQLWECLYLL